jgi:hypothetical protein
LNANAIGKYQLWGLFLHRSRAQEIKRRRRRRRRRRRGDARAWILTFRVSIAVTPFSFSHEDSVESYRFSAEVRLYVPLPRLVEPNVAHSEAERERRTRTSPPENKRKRGFFLYRLSRERERKSADVSVIC